MSSLSIRARITLWFVALSAVIFAGFSAGLWALARRSAYARLDDTLRERARAVATVVEYERGEYEVERNDAMTDPFETAVASGEAVHGFLIATRPDGHRIAASRSMKTIELPADLLAGPLPRTETRRMPTGPDGTRELRVHVGLYAPRLDDEEELASGELERVGLLVAVVWDTSEVDAQLASLALILGAVFPAVLLAAALCGGFLSARIAGPLSAMASTAREIESKDLSRRLPTAGTGDEIEQLASALNDAFARLQAAFERQARFTADAAHELRTPISIVRTQAEVALRRERDPEDYREALAEIVAAASRMEQTIEGLLVLARADAGSVVAPEEPIDLAQVARETVEAFDAEVAKSKGIALHVRNGDPVPARAERRQIEIILRNLLSNAVRHSEVGGRIEIDARRANGTATIEVADTGCGIPPEALPHIFDRFFRVDEARARADGGSGLGLSIVREIAERLGGSVGAKSTPGEGTTITVELPSADAPPRGERA